MGLRQIGTILTKEKFLTRLKIFLLRVKGPAYQKLNSSKATRHHMRENSFNLESVLSQLRKELILLHLEVLQGQAVEEVPVVIDSFAKLIPLCKTSSNKYANKRRLTPSTQLTVAFIKL
jgi:hypothetical protein